MTPWEYRLTWAAFGAASLVALGIMAAGLLYWLGPIVIARGLARWSQMPK